MRPSSFRLKLRVPDNARGDITRKLLDWAEHQKSAKESNWFLYELQQHRRFQRELAESIHEDTRAPEGTSIEFLGVRLIEIFHYEEFEKVKLGLKAMFPELNERGNDFIEGLEKISDAITTGMWHPVGTLYNDIPVGGSGGRVARHISTIHPCIRSIDVEIQKMAPSLMIVSFDAQLKDLATLQLLELHSREYLGKSGTVKIHIGKYPNVGIVLRSPETTMIETIDEWLLTIRASIEEIVSPYLKGYFLSKDSNKHHLPAIEIYNLSREKTQQKDFLAWTHIAGRWLHSLGFSLSPRNWFGNDELVFNWRNSDRSAKFNRANRVLVFDEKFSGYSGTMRQNLNYLFIELTPLIATVEFFDDVQKVLEKMRHRIFDVISKKRDLSRSIKLYQSFQVLGRTIQRLNLEIEKKLVFFWNNKFFDTSNMIEIQFNKKNKRVRKKDLISIANDGQDRIKTLYELVFDQIVFIDRVFSADIEFFNIDAIYRLQKRTFWLTIVATVVGIIGVTLNLDEFSKFFGNILKALR